MAVVAKVTQSSSLLRPFGYNSCVVSGSAAEQSGRCAAGRPPTPCGVGDSIVNFAFLGAAQQLSVVASTSHPIWVAQGLRLQLNLVQQ